MNEEKKPAIGNLDDLLRETEGAAPKDYNFEKIMALIEKTREMKKEEKRRSQITQDYFKQLKEKLEESSSYLEKARKNLDNIEVRERHQPEINTMEEYESFMQKSDQEVEDEMANIRVQLANLESRVSKFNEKTVHADDFYKKSMETLETISRSLSGDHN